MAGVARGFVLNLKHRWRELSRQRQFDALGAGKMRFVGCQFLVRLTSGAHTHEPMASAFQYRPKFVDIRVKKPDAAKASRAPNDRACDHIGCDRAGIHRAPKARDRIGEYWHFCVEHAADYNRRWDYFSGMSDDDLTNWQKQEETGHRPTWTFRSGRLDRYSAATRRFRNGQASDPFGMFGANDGASPQPAAPRRRISRLQVMALEAMSLDENATAADIRTRYAELVKRWHPDSNGGDRSAETNLQRVLKAYQTLKAGGLV